MGAVVSPTVAGPLGRDEGGVVQQGSLGLSVLVVPLPPLPPSPSAWLVVPDECAAKHFFFTCN